LLLILKRPALFILKFEEIAGRGKKQLTFDQIKLEDTVIETEGENEPKITRGAAFYAAEDADMTLR